MIKKDNKNSIYAYKRGDHVKDVTGSVGGMGPPLSIL